MRRTIVKIVVLTITTLALPVAVGALGVSRALDTTYPPPPGGQNPSPRSDPTAAASPEGPAATIDPDLPTVAVVLGPEGANAADVLAPYEVFAAAGRFNVLTVSPTEAPVTLTGGLDLVPDLSFAELGRRLPGPPEVIVVPQIHGRTTEVVDWLRHQDRRGAPLVMSVCVGAGVLAEAGMLEDRPATSHWLGLIGLRRSHPEVDWTAGVRFVDDGDVITTAGVLSGLDGSLRVVERLAGARVAARVADDLAWNGYRPGTTVDIPAQTPRPSDLVALLSAAYRWDRPTTGVMLTDGIGEIELASALRPYTELSYLAHLRTISEDGAPVRSRHGLLFLPRSDWHTAAPDLDRVLALGTGGSASIPPESAVPITTLHPTGEFPFDSALRDIATSYDTATATWVARSLQYPLPTHSRPEDQGAWPWELTMRPLLLAALGLALGVLLLRLTPRRAGVADRRRPRPPSTPNPLPRASEQ